MLWWRHTACKELSETCFASRKMKIAMVALSIIVWFVVVHASSLEVLLRRGDEALRQRRDPRKALELYEEAKLAAPDNMAVLQGMAMALGALNDHARATGYWIRAVQSSPSPGPELLYNTALGYLQLGSLKDAIEYFSRCGSHFRPAVIKLASIYRDLNRHQDMLSLLDQAIKLEPGNPDAWAYKGDALVNLKRFADAVKVYEEALKKATASPNPPVKGIVEILGGLGDAYSNLKRPDKAVVFYDKALSQGLKARLPLRMVSSSAIGSYFAKLEFGSWRALELGERQIVDVALRSLRDDPLVKEGKAGCAVSPYRMLFLQRPELGLAVARSWSRALVNLELALGGAEFEAERVDAKDSSILTAAEVEAERVDAVANAKGEDSSILTAACRNAPLQLGYISRRFYDYPGTQLMLALFAAHDRKTTCVTTFAYGPDDLTSNYRAIVANTSDAFFDITNMSTRQAASTVRSQFLDVLLEYDGLHDFNSMRLLAHRPASIIISWLGFASNVGQGWQGQAQAQQPVDFLLADRHVLPPDLPPSMLSTRARGEKLILLPHYQPQSLLPEERGPLPGEAWVPEYRALTRLGLLRDFGADSSLDSAESHSSAIHGKWLLSLNRMSKMTPELFHGIANVLRAEPSAYLCLMTELPATTSMVFLHAAHHGIARERLLLFRRLPKKDYKRLLRVGSLFIDTRNYGSHTTASDAMIQGLPVLTLPGATFASRVALSISHQLGAGSPSFAARLLVVSSEKGWERVALSLLRHPRSLSLQSLRTASASRGRCLGNSAVFASNLERAALAAKEVRAVGLLGKLHVFSPRDRGSCQA